jgi:glutamine amidotransferase|tara:strand:+ start:252 stop:878 length:627 start_codon:yes stop_codon:yes gene_type:complete
MTVAIIDCGSGNLRSAAKAFELYAEGTVEVTADPETVRKADHIVLPGQGAFADCRRGLASIDGMDEAIEEVVVQKGRPFLGICVGMQLMATAGLEHGRHDGFGWIDGEVKPIELSDSSLKIPHMGWNELSIQQDHPLLDGVEDGTHVYFVHSYNFAVDDPDSVLSTTDYGGEQTAIVGRDNLIGTQFHPEKSQKAGLAMVANFLAWKP